MRRALIVTQVAIAFVLLIGAGLLLASFRHVLAIDPGFTSDGILTASINLPPSRYAEDGVIRRFTAEALQAVRSVPGVVVAGATTAIPFGDEYDEDVIFPEGHHLNQGDSLIAPYYSSVTTGYFEAMRVRLVSGRFFDDRDGPESPRVVIVDQRLAKRFWPGIDPVGRRMYEPTDKTDLLRITDKTTWFTVIGVVGEVKLRGLVEGVGQTGAYYMPQAQNPYRMLTLAVRTSGTAPQAVAGAIRVAIARIDRELPLFDVTTMVERADRSVATRRASMLLSMTFACLALFLSAIGIYGVLAYLVTLRTKEIGIRMALGSSSRAVFRLILGEGLVLIVAGFALGAAGAVAFRRTLQSELFGVGASDPVVLLVVVGVLALVAFAACAIPARRATRNRSDRRPGRVAASASASFVVQRDERIDSRRSPGG